MYILVSRFFSPYIIRSVLCLAKAQARSTLKNSMNFFFVYFLSSLSANSPDFSSHCVFSLYLLEIDDFLSHFLSSLVQQLDCLAADFFFFSNLCDFKRPSIFSVFSDENLLSCTHVESWKIPLDFLSIFHPKSDFKSNLTDDQIAVDSLRYATHFFSSREDVEEEKFCALANFARVQHFVENIFFHSLSHSPVPLKNIFILLAVLVRSLNESTCRSC